MEIKGTNRVLIQSFSVAEFGLNELKFKATVTSTMVF